MKKLLCCAALLAAGYSHSLFAMHSLRLNNALMRCESLTEAKQLIRAGADVNAQDENDKSTPLMRAAQYGNVELCDLLLDHGADIHARDENGATALMWAVMGDHRTSPGGRLICHDGHEEVCRLLIARGADVNAAADDGVTSLSYAVFRGSMTTYIDNERETFSIDHTPCNESICRLLLELGAQLSARDQNGISTLIFTLPRSKDAIARILITCPIFNPMRTEYHANISRDRIFTALCALNRVRPRLPRDVRYYILQAKSGLRKDVGNCAFGIHRDHNERAPFLPIPTVRRLLQSGLLNSEKTVSEMKKNHVVRIAPYMIEALPQAGNDAMRALLDPKRFEANFDAETEANIRRRLGLNQKELAPSAKQNKRRRISTRELKDL